MSLRSCVACPKRRQKLELVIENEDSVPSTKGAARCMHEGKLEVNQLKLFEMWGATKYPSRAQVVSRKCPSSARCLLYQLLRCGRRPLSTIFHSWRILLGRLEKKSLLTHQALLHCAASSGNHQQARCGPCTWSISPVRDPALQL